MKNRWKSSRQAVYNIGYHLIWCPQYRSKVLTPPIDHRLKELLLEKSQKRGTVIEKMEIMPDHVHLFVKAPPTHPPHYLVQQFKGYTSRMLRQEFPGLKSRLPTLWTRSYYCESVGHLSEATVKRYLEEQKNK